MVENYGANSCMIQQTDYLAQQIKYLQNELIRMNSDLQEKDLIIKKMKGSDIAQVKIAVPAFIFKDDYSKCLYINYKDGKCISFFANFYIESCSKKIYDDGFNCQNEYIFDVKILTGVTKKINIPFDKFNAKEIIHEFQIKGGVQFTNTFKSTILGQALFNHLISFINDASVEVEKYYTGWDIDNNKTFYRRKSINKSLFNSQNKIYKIDLNTDKIKRYILKYLEGMNVFDDNTGLFLILWLHNALLWSILNVYECNIEQVLIITGEKVPLNQISQYFLKIFNRDDTSSPVSFSKGIKEFDKQAYDVKDEVIIIDDDSNNEKNKSDYTVHIVNSYTHRTQLSKSFNTIPGGKKFSLRANVAIISKDIAFTNIFSNEEMVLLVLENEFFNKGKFSELDFAGDEIPAYIDYFIRFIEQNLELVIRTIEINRKKYFNKYNDVFESYSYLKTFVSLMVTAEIMNIFYEKNDVQMIDHFKGGSKTCADIVTEKLNNSYEWNDVEGITQLFKEKVLELADQDDINVVNASNGHCNSEFNPIKPSIFFNKNKIFISIDSLRKIIDTCFPIKIPVLRLQKALKSNGWLIYNKGSYETKPTINFPNNYTGRKSMITITKELFIDEGIISPFSEF